MMKGDLDTEVPAFNTNFAALAKIWPELPEKIVVSKWMSLPLRRRPTDTYSLSTIVSCNNTNETKAKTRSVTSQTGVQ